jgi:hypothetical protein
MPVLPRKEPTMTDAQAAAAVERMTGAIMAAIANSAYCENIQVVIGSLGAVVGCVAQASGKPDKCLSILNKLARSVSTGELLD